MVKDSIESAAGLDETLRAAVRILKEEREHYNRVGIYTCSKGTPSFFTTTSSRPPATPVSRLGEACAEPR